MAGERTGPLAEALASWGCAVPPGARYDTNAKVNPPLRTAEDCAALLAGLLDGTIDAIATDHAPHTEVDKDCEFGEAAFGISGFETALAALLALVHAGRLPLATLIAALTERPARAWNLDAGTLQARRAGRSRRSSIPTRSGRWIRRASPRRGATRRWRADAARARADDAAGRRDGLRRGAEGEHER